MVFSHIPLQLHQSLSDQQASSHRQLSERERAWQQQLADERRKHAQELSELHGTSRQLQERGEDRHRQERTQLLEQAHRDAAKWKHEAERWKAKCLDADRLVVVSETVLVALKRITKVPESKRAPSFEPMKAAGNDSARSTADLDAQMARLNAENELLRGEKDALLSQRNQLIAQVNALRILRFSTLAQTKKLASFYDETVSKQMEHSRQVQAQLNSRLAAQDSASATISSPQPLNMHATANVELKFDPTLLVCFRR